MIEGMRNLLAIMGIRRLSDLSTDNLIFKDNDGILHMDIDEYFDNILRSWAYRDLATQEQQDNTK